MLTRAQSVLDCVDVVGLQVSRRGRAAQRGARGGAALHRTTPPPLMPVMRCTLHPPAAKPTARTRSLRENKHGRVKAIGMSVKVDVGWGGVGQARLGSAAAAVALCGREGPATLDPPPLAAATASKLTGDAGQQAGEVEEGVGEGAAHQEAAARRSRRGGGGGCGGWASAAGPAMLQRSGYSSTRIPVRRLFSRTNPARAPDGHHQGGADEPQLSGRQVQGARVDFRRRQEAHQQVGQARQQALGGQVEDEDVLR